MTGPRSMAAKSEAPVAAAAVNEGRQSRPRHAESVGDDVKISREDAMPVEHDYGQSGTTSRAR